MTDPVGQDAQISAFLAAMAQGRMHHAWLLAGPMGTGKALFAEAAAARYLAEASGHPVDGAAFVPAADHPTMRLIAAGSHPDHRRLARLPRDKGGDLARNITVDQVRGLQPFFAVTPSLSPRRAIVIDAIDDLEPPAANALLKNLEEPPADTLFLLVSHASGRLLPTIRSRCRLLRFAPLEPDDMATVLRRLLPDTAEREIAALIAGGGGTPGRAMGLAGLDIAALDAAMQDIARTGDPANATRGMLARQLALKAAQPRYEAFLDRLPAFIAARAAERRGAAMAGAIDLWDEARAISARARSLSLDPQTTVFELAGLVAALAPGDASAKA